MRTGECTKAGERDSKSRWEGSIPSVRAVTALFPSSMVAGRVKIIPVTPMAESGVVVGGEFVSIARGRHITQHTAV